jgi:hypothetical protein
MEQNHRIGPGCVNDKNASWRDLSSVHANTNRRSSRQLCVGGDAEKDALPLIMIGPYPGRV